MAPLARLIPARCGLVRALEGPGCVVLSRALSSAEGGDASTSSSGSLLPQWMRSRLPSVLGGDRETLKELEGLTMVRIDLDDLHAPAHPDAHSRIASLARQDSYLSQISAARKLGSISGSAFGAKASDPQTQGFFRNTELVIAALTDDEKKLETVSASREAALAQQLDLSVDQVQQVFGRFKYTKHMMSVLAQRKRDGLDMPSSIEDVEKLTGNWRSFVSGGGVDPATTPATTSATIVVPADALHPKHGGQCGLAGMTVGRSTKCPRYRKSYKACCGRHR